jgi:hypothetical protein
VLVNMGTGIVASAHYLMSGFAIAVVLGVFPAVAQANACVPTGSPLGHNHV